MPSIKERPILFSGDMVRALLAGTKTQTRRVVKPQPHIDAMGNFCWDGGNFGQDFNGPHIQAIASPIPSSKTGRVHCPYGKPGDRLWVREDWRRIGAECGCSESPCCCPKLGDIAYRATQDDADSKWKPSIHMPRAASRILLEIVSVRVERLKDISEADAVAEGCVAEPCDHSRQSCEDIGCYGPTAAGAYHWLWNQLNGAGSWDANPWVWVIEFKRVEK